MTNRNKLFLIGAMALLMSTAWAERTMAQQVYVDYYAPQFYGDYLVFYDETGSPIYYEGDTAYAVPPDSPEYNELVNHFQDNEDAYFRWFEEVGYSNLQYRRTPVQDYYKPRYYNGYLVFFEGGQPVYYVDGSMLVIPTTDRRHARLMRHYHKHRAAYERWYRSVGRQYHWYIRPVYTDYYTPLYFRGYLIFYDASGLPYYYRGGQTVYIPSTHRHYHTYVSHYSSHRQHYDRWYRERGRNHHEYRQPKSYRKRVIAPKAPRATHGRAENRKYRPTIRPSHKPTIRPADHKPTIHPGDHQPPPEPSRHDPIRPSQQDRSHPTIQPSHPAPVVQPKPPTPVIRPNEKKEDKKRIRPVIKPK